MSSVAVQTNTAETLTPHEQWLGERKLGIGGSDVAGIFNEGYSCARRLAYEKLGVPPDFTRTEAQERVLRRGLRMEEVVAEEYADSTKRKIRRMATRVSKDFPWMRVNVDRQILNDPRGPGALEVKTASPWIFDDMAESGLPEQYVLQLQHSLIVTGYKWGAFAVMNMSTWEMLRFERELNPTLSTVIVAREAQFWHEYIEPAREVIIEQRGDTNFSTLLPMLKLPEALPKFNDKRCASCLWRKTCRGQAVIVPDKEDSGYVVDDGLAEIGADYIQLLNAATRTSGALEECKNDLKNAVGDRPGVIIPSIQKRIRFKEQKGRSTWDGKGLEALRDLLKKRTEPEFQQLAISIDGCKKQGQPARPFYFEEWDGDF